MILPCYNTEGSLMLPMYPQFLAGTRILRRSLMILPCYNTEGSLMLPASLKHPCLNPPTLCYIQPQSIPQLIHTLMQSLESFSHQSLHIVPRMFQLKFHLILLHHCIVLLPQKIFLQLASPTPLPVYEQHSLPPHGCTEPPAPLFLSPSFFQPPFHPALPPLPQSESL